VLLQLAGHLAKHQRELPAGRHLVGLMEAELQIYKQKTEEAEQGQLGDPQRMFDTSQYSR
jgi:hypothetical protein